MKDPIEVLIDPSALGLVDNYVLGGKVKLKVPENVPLFVDEGPDRKQIGTVENVKLGSDGLQVSLRITDDLARFDLVNADIPHFSIGVNTPPESDEELRVWERGRMYGEQIRQLEEHQLWTDRLHVQRSWVIYRNQLRDTPLYGSAREGYQEGYIQD